MSNAISIIFDFYNQYEYSIQVKTIVKDEEVRILELVLFSNIALRQLFDLKNFGTPLAKVLSAINYPTESYYFYSKLLLGLSLKELAAIIPIISALGVEIEKLIPFMTPLRMLRLQPGNSDKKIADEFWPKSPVCVDKRIQKASRTINSEIDFQNGKPIFRLSTSGFGLFGKGINYYIPVSVALLYKYFLDNHKMEGLFGRQLLRVANYCGEAFLNNEVSIRSLSTLPFFIAEKVINENK